MPLDTIAWSIRLLVVTVAAMLVYPALWPEAPILDGDSAQYLEVAADLDDGALDYLHDRAPGYPLLLSVTGSSRAPGRRLLIVSLAVHALAICVLAMALRAIDVPTRWVVLFAALLMLPPYVEPAAYVMTENLAALTLACAAGGLVVGLRRGSHWILLTAGLSTGAAAAVRPAYVLLAPALAIVLFLTPRICPVISPRIARRAAAWVVGGAILVLAPVVAANHRNAGFLGLVPTTGMHLSTKTMPFIERLPDEYAEAREILVRERDRQLTMRGGTHTGTQTIWSVRSDLQEGTGVPAHELSSYLLRMNLRLIARAPVEYLREVARSMATYWFPAAGPLAAMDMRALRVLWVLLHVAVAGAFALQLIVCAGVTCYRVSERLLGTGASADRAPRRLEAAACLIAATIIFYTMLVSCFLDIGDVRHRRPTDMLILFTVFAGAWVWVRSLRPANISR